MTSEIKEQINQLRVEIQHLQGRNTALQLDSHHLKAWNKELREELKDYRFLLNELSALEEANKALTDDAARLRKAWVRRAQLYKELSAQAAKSEFELAAYKEAVDHLRGQPAEKFIGGFVAQRLAAQPADKDIKEDALCNQYPS